MKTKMSLLINVLIVILEIVGLWYSISSLREQVFLYYTQDSNIFLLIASLYYLLNYKKKDKQKNVSFLKYGATISVTITFLVVVFILTPTLGGNYKWFMLYRANLYYHTLCPILAFITFMFFDKVKINGNKDVLLSFAFTFIYTIVFLLLNIFKLVYGPYPFLHVYENSIIESIIWFLIIDGGALLLSYGLMKLRKKINRQVL